ncbi:hypothetical protein [Okeania sp. SIO2B3]|uniref:hypothetical protein n=1 Tax=Okeania sp. SIO2B3 TaxID=2607784 RepID=UPI0013BFD4FA|nr:hypothetical protein [Okeania sp. SIO2B3]NET43796.1 hypothetical protein [Okeania sp. SIO2B3]
MSVSNSAKFSAIQAFHPLVFFDCTTPLTKTGNSSRLVMVWHSELWVMIMLSGVKFNNLG